MSGTSEQLEKHVQKTWHSQTHSNTHTHTQTWWGGDKK